MHSATLPLTGYREAKAVHPSRGPSMASIIKWLQLCLYQFELSAASSMKSMLA